MNLEQKAPRSPTVCACTDSTHTLSSIAVAHFTSALHHLILHQSYISVVYKICSLILCQSFNIRLIMSIDDELNLAERIAREREQERKQNNMMKLVSTIDVSSVRMILERENF